MQVRLFVRYRFFIVIAGLQKSERTDTRSVE